MNDEAACCEAAQPTTKKTKVSDTNCVGFFVTYILSDSHLQVTERKYLSVLSVHAPLFFRLNTSQKSFKQEIGLRVTCIFLPIERSLSVLQSAYYQCSIEIYLTS